MTQAVESPVRRAVDSAVRQVRAAHALTAEGWQSDLLVSVGPDGRVSAIEPARTPAMMRGQRAVDLLVPAMPNAHSHAFQYRVAGLAERAGQGADDSLLRQRMNEAIDSLDPQSLYESARSLYQRMRANGYGSVAEFHLVHRAGGTAAIETADALIRAARDARMRLLLLPVLLRRGGFNGTPLDARQARFAIDLQAYGRLLEQLAERARHDPRLTIGVAPQSLRGVGHEDLQALLALRAAIVPDCPVHLHIASDEAEIDDCIVHTGARPIEWLCSHFDVDRHWVLVHATHATPHELALLADRQSVVCLCATTEANQGLGTFDMATWWPSDGALAIGSDSNVSVSAGEELRWIEYTTRLLTRQRSRLVTDQNPHPGSALWRRAVAGGRQAMGCPFPGLAVGAPADLLAIRRDDDGIAPDEALDDMVFTQRVTHAEMIDF